MKGWVMVQEQGFTGEKELKVWLEKAREFVKGLGSK